MVKFKNDYKKYKRKVKVFVLRKLDYIFKKKIKKYELK